MAILNACQKKYLVFVTSLVNTYTVLYICTESVNLFRLPEGPVDSEGELPNLELAWHEIGKTPLVSDHAPPRLWLSPNDRTLVYANT